MGGDDQDVLEDGLTSRARQRIQGEVEWRADGGEWRADGVNGERTGGLGEIWEEASARTKLGN